MYQVTETGQDDHTMRTPIHRRPWTVPVDIDVCSNSDRWVDME